MLPGKTYTPEDVARILRKRIWFLLVPFALVAAGTAAVARILPDRYRAETTLQVVPQRVPESYVRSTVTATVQGRLQAIRQKILSRTYLERLIQDFNLYPVERRTGIMEDVVEQMRRDIVVTTQGEAFRLSYVSGDARTAMRVTESLASMFVNESLTDRAALAEGTDQFLESQLADVGGRLAENEKKLEAYRRQHDGELPTQLESNLRAGQNAQTQVQSLTDAIGRDQERRIILERQLAELEAGSAPSEVAPAPTGRAQDASTLNVAQQLALARRNLDALIARGLTDAHPDVRQWQRTVRDLEKQAAAEASRAPATPAPVAVSAADVARQRRVADLRENLDSLNAQLSRNQAEEKRLRDVVATYQKRVEMAPTRESELVQLMRDYDTLNGTYKSLLAKKEESKISANLERLQGGERFNVLDPARMPERPFSPDRLRIRLLGMVAGLALGLALIALLEYRDSSFKTDDEVARILSLPVLAVVPMMKSASDRRRAFVRRLVVGIGLGGTVLACLAVVAYTFVR